MLIYGGGIVMYHISALFNYFGFVKPNVIYQSLT